MSGKCEAINIFCVPKTLEKKKGAESFITAEQHYVTCVEHTNKTSGHNIPKQFSNWLYLPLFFVFFLYSALIDVL